jgi:hypothetical protein
MHQYHVKTKWALNPWLLVAQQCALQMVLPSRASCATANLDKTYRKDILGREWLFFGDDDEMEVSESFDDVEYDYYTGNEGPISA